ncbi:hypothetical protein KKF38_02635, partial [Patescibacteria group bacterium]|nr:hypothetical protein [Patescibacteria group bacterium]
MTDKNSQNPNPPVTDGDENTATPSSPKDEGKQPPQDEGAALPKKASSPLQSDDELSEDQFITGGDDHSFITNVPIPAHPNTQFDEQKFL